MGLITFGKFCVQSRKIGILKSQWSSLNSQKAMNFSQCCSILVQSEKLACSSQEITARIQNPPLNPTSFPAQHKVSSEAHQVISGHALAVEERLRIISSVPSPVGLVQVHSTTALMRLVQTTRSWLQLPWTFEGLWGIVALFSRNAAARFQPAFILQSNVSWSSAQQGSS